MADKNVTIKDVALAAGVSTKTVSNVINGNDDQMRPETKARVKNVVQRLGYKVNHSAQTLKRGRSGVIGFAVPNFDQPFNGYVTDLLTDAARERKYGVVVSTYGKLPDRFDTFVQEAPRLNADGWIILADSPIERHSLIFRQQYPIVIIGDYSAHGLLDMVTMPNVEAARTMTTWLLDCGCRHVAFIGAPPSIVPISENDAFSSDDQRLNAVFAADEGNSHLRLQGYLRALISRNVPVDWRYILPCERLTTGDGAATAFTMIDRGIRPDAVVCVNDAVALGVISALTTANFSVPGDIQVTGFDSIPDGEFSVPPLTTVDPRTDQYITMALDALIQRIEHDDTPPSTFTSGFRIIQRDSTLHE